MATPQGQYHQDRSEAYDAVLAAIQQRIEAIPLSVADEVRMLSPGDARAAAERDVWALFQKGIRHLKDGGQMDSPGAFGTAVSKASLRSSSIAACLQLKPPEYDENYVPAEFSTGAAEALFWSRRLLEAAIADAPKSQSLIRQRLGFTVPLVAPEKETVADPELSGVFDAAQRSQKSADTGDDPVMAAVRKQAVLSFNLICSVYAPIAQECKKEISALFTVEPDAPKPSPKGRSFDF